MYNTELYNNLLQSQSSQYSFSEMTKTLVICGSLLFNNSGSLIQRQARVGFPENMGGSDAHIISHIYSSDSPTWSDIGTTYSPLEDTNSDIPETFYVLSKLTFLEGDAVAEKEADQFFNQVKVKTKKILVR